MNIYCINNILIVNKNKKFMVDYTDEFFRLDIRLNLAEIEVQQV